MAEIIETGGNSMGKCDKPLRVLHRLPPLWGLPNAIR